MLSISLLLFKGYYCHLCTLRFFFIFVEVVEKAKEGYESDVPELRREKKTRRSRSFESSTRGFDR